MQLDLVVSYTFSAADGAWIAHVQCRSLDFAQFAAKHVRESCIIVCFDPFFLNLTVGFT